jgi:hypothetical protein
MPNATPKKISSEHALMDDGARAGAVPGVRRRVTEATLPRRQPTDGACHHSAPS